MSLRTQILIPITITLVLVTLLITTSSWLTLDSQEQAGEDIKRLKEVDTTLVTVNDSFKKVNELLHQTYQMVDFIDHTQALDKYYNHAMPIAKLIGKLDTKRSSPKLKTLLSELEDANEQWLAAVGIPLGVKTAQLVPTYEHFMQAEKRMAELLDAALHASISDIEKTISESHMAISNSLWSAIYLVCLISLVAFGMGIMLAQQISKPLSRLARAASDLNQGNTEVVFPGIDRMDEVGTVARAVAEFRDRIIEALKTADSEECLHKVAAQQNEELREQAKQLEEALAQEKELNELQRTFVSMASHEFRTPLAIIDGSAQKLLRKSSELSPDQIQTRSKKIRDAVVRMSRLMESTLSAARMDSGNINIEPAACDLHQLLVDACDRQGEISPGYAISLQAQGLPDKITADPSALDQIFSNLLSNAVKYSPEGGNIEVLAKADGNGSVSITVTDNGLGMDEDEVPKIFGRYFRARTSTGIAGTGIGLNLVQLLVKAHNGEVNVASRKGEGSTFTVTLPISGPLMTGPTTADAA